MSSGGGKKSTTTSVNTNDPPEWSVPYFKNALDLSGAYANEPYQAYTGDRVAGADTMNPYTTNAYSDQLVNQVSGDITKNYTDAVAPSLMA